MDVKDKSSFKFTNQEIKQEIEIILLKGIYPYEYFDDQERLEKIE